MSINAIATKLTSTKVLIDELIMMGFVEFASLVEKKFDFTDTVWMEISKSELRVEKYEGLPH